MSAPRLYHSETLLLPDGRVLVSGGGRYSDGTEPTDQFSAEFFSPPYLFKGPRPAITSAPSQLSSCPQRFRRNSSAMVLRHFRVEFGEAVRAGTRLTLFSAEKPDRHFTVVTFLMDKVSGVMLDLKTGVPCYQVEDEEGRIHLLLQLPIEEENENRWCLWRPDQADFDSRSIFDGALLEE